MLNKPVIQVLRRILQENQKEEFWIVGPRTGKMLYWLLRVLEPEVALEIGTSVGYSALWMACALAGNKKGRVITVESHDGRFKQAQKNIEEAGMGAWILQVKGHAPEIFSENVFTEPPGFVFLDATKQEHQSYFDALFSRMVSGGMLVVDNVRSHRFGDMEKFIETMHKHSGLKVVEIPVGDGLLIARVI